MERRQYVCVILPGIRYCFMWRKYSASQKNLQETIIINIEETKKMGTLEKFFEECGLELIEDDILSARKQLIGFTPIELSVS